MLFSKEDITELERLAEEPPSSLLTSPPVEMEHRNLLRRVIAHLKSLPESDEPTFTVLGRDQLAQATVVHWIERARVAGVPEEKINRALQRYEEIVNFQSEHPDRVKVPD